jgi:hypothetical protein
VPCTLEVCRLRNKMMRKSAYRAKSCSLMLGCQGRPPFLMFESEVMHSCAFECAHSLRRLVDLPQVVDEDISCKTRWR